MACVEPWWRAIASSASLRSCFSVVEALQQFLLIHLGRGFVRAQPVEAGLEGDVRLRFRAQRGKQLRDEPFAAFHQALEVSGSAEAILRLFVALLRFLDPLLELRHTFAALVRELARFSALSFSS